MKRATILVIVLLPLSAIGWLLLSEKSTNHYDSLQEARESGALDRGWIPAFLPESAHAIIEQHRVDVAAIDVKFQFSPDDLSSIRAACTEKSFVSGTRTFECQHRGLAIVISVTEEGAGHAYSADAA